MSENAPQFGMLRSNAPTQAVALFETPLGVCGLAWSDHAITRCELPCDSSDTTRQDLLQRFPGVPLCTTPPPWIQSVTADVTAMMSGDATAWGRLGRVSLDMTVAPPFFRDVWEAARLIPLGQTLSYGELAALLGQPGAARAVGQALGANPFAPIVPCHRILGKGQSAGGFSALGGVKTKLRLLQMEHARFGGPGLFDT